MMRSGVETLLDQRELPIGNFAGGDTINVTVGESAKLVFSK